MLGIEAEKRRVLNQIRGVSTTKRPSKRRTRRPREFRHGLLALQRYFVHFNGKMNEIGREKTQRTQKRARTLRNEIATILSPLFLRFLRFLAATTFEALQALVNEVAL